MLKVGVFGTGDTGKFHLSNWKEIAGAELVGFYDRDDDSAKGISEKYQLPRFLDAASLMDACDAVAIAAPATYHFELCELAIKKGKHIFVDSPLANSMEEARQLVKLAQESGVKFQVGHAERFNPAFLAVRDMQPEPMFIEVHRLSSFQETGTTTNVILDLMIHDIDIILSLVKSDVKSISASAVGVLSESPDIANVRMEFHNGCVANLTASRISMNKMQKMRLFQKDAYIGIDFLNKKTEIIRLKEAQHPADIAFDIETPAGKKTIAIANPPVPDTHAGKMELEEFKNAIGNNTRPIVSEMDGLAAMDVAHQILTSIRNNIITR